MSKLRAVTVLSATLLVTCGLFGLAQSGGAAARPPSEQSSQEARPKPSSAGATVVRLAGVDSVIEQAIADGKRMGSGRSIRSTR
jgi:ABC-type phosphate transport system substrate-binding protein